MDLRAFVTVSMAALAALVASPAQAATADGLVPVYSRNLDELYLRPDAKLASYRKVLIDPVRVGFHPDWLRYGYTANPARPVGQETVRRIAAGIANDAQANIVEAFKARGYEIVNAAGPDVLRLSPVVADLHVNAPSRFSPWQERAFTREAGQAVLLLEVRDSVSGTMLGRVAHLGRAEQMGQFARANDVSNRFWFDALTRRWATSCAAELGTH
jgi:hypothetical protein